MTRHAALALLSLVLLAVAARGCAHSAGGAPGAPASVAVLRDGVHVGYASPMADGAYTAAHALRQPGAYTVGGIGAPFSVDAAGRDLAHFAALSEAPVSLREAREGEVLSWSNGRARGRWLVVGASEGGIVACGLEGWVVYGDSGTGGYAEDDGALVGILTNAALSGDWRDSLACESGQQVRLESVP